MVTADAEDVNSPLPGAAHAARIFESQAEGPGSAAFDISAWAKGASRTHRSVPIYQRADLVADLDDLTRRIQQAGDEAEKAELQEQWDAVAQEFSDSKLLIKVKGLSKDEAKAIQAASMLEGWDEYETGARLLAEAIVEPQMTWLQMLELEEAVGPAQISLIVSAFSLAMSSPPPAVSLERAGNG